jgi:hypothetical protein
MNAVVRVRTTSYGVHWPEGHRGNWEDIFIAFGEKKYFCEVLTVDHWNEEETENRSNNFALGESVVRFDACERCYCSDEECDRHHCDGCFSIAVDAKEIGIEEVKRAVNLACKFLGLNEYHIELEEPPEDAMEAFEEHQKRIREWEAAGKPPFKVVLAESFIKSWEKLGGSREDWKDYEIEPSKAEEKNPKK